MKRNGKDINTTHEGTRTPTLADVRKQTGKTQTQVAKKMGVTQGRVSQIEQQFPDVTFPVLQNYLKALGGDIRLVVPGATFDATAMEADRSRDESRRVRRYRDRGDAGRFV